MHEQWGDHWGDRYESTGKKYLREILDKYEREGRLGNHIVDVGSGKMPLTEELEKADRRILRLDIGAPQVIQKEGSLLMPFDIEKISDGSTSTKRAALKIAEFLGIDDLRQADQRVIDTFILSNVLNYVDYKQVLKDLSAFLKPKGLMIINNLIHNGAMGYGDLFSPNKPMEVDDIERAMEALQFTKIDSVPTMIGLKEDFIRVFELDERIV